MSSRLSGLCQRSIVRLFDLGHDVLGEPAGQALLGFGEVVGVERGAGGQGPVPFVAADGVE